ncbi:MAG: serine/threonine protein kinase [Deltaproteobacteria bacterium]|nr:serine/threonine protein kinase [Deltaproteobacteria bacterium]
MPSLVLGDLEVGEEIGRGGMSTVYRARNTALDRPAAVKLLPESLADDPAMVARFRREAQLLAKVDHPAVVRVFGAGSHEGVHWLEMELVEGEPVHARGPLAPGEAVAVVQQLCAALDAAHEVGVVHRDVKPANVLIRPDGSVKLVDFGIASSSAGRRLTRTGNAVGTPGFMAPEILSGAEPSKAMDVFAAGALLYTLMTGHPPEGAFEPPPAHAEAIRRALAPEPSARFATAGEFAAALSRPAQTTALHPGLPPDEVVWLRAAAAAWTLASAAMLYALLLCVTPKVYEGDVPPLVVQGVRELADGTKLSMARFEVMPLLVGLAVVLFLAAPAHGALLGRWRRLSLPAPSSEVRLAHGPWSFGLGVVLCGAYLGRIALETQGVFTLSPYVPLVAGLAEVAALWWFWTAVLEGTRRGRALMREPMVVFGFLLGLIPPVHNLARYLETLG